MADITTSSRPEAASGKATVREPAATARPARLVSLDIFRGATIAGMILVNNPGTWDAIHWPLEHVEWHGWCTRESLRRLARPINASRRCCSHPRTY